MDVEFPLSDSNALEGETKWKGGSGKRIIDKELGETNGFEWITADDDCNEHEICWTPGITGHGVKVKKECL